MNKDRLREEIAEDEGCKYEVYLDHLGLPTCGIGHLDHLTIGGMTNTGSQPVGTVVEQERVKGLFALDMAVTIDECKVLYPDFNELPEEAQHIICNMMFNMGRPRLSKFKGMKAGVDARDWQAAADEMVDSRWYTQVPNRARRLVDRMRALADG
jgi:lysozyme